MDKHFNLFYSYDQGNLENDKRVKHLEDNITRAFIVCLQNLEKQNQNKFLKELIKGIKITQNEKHIIYDLQNTIHYKKDVSTKYVLIIQRDEKPVIIDCLKKLAETTGNRPDAWIISDDFAILVESKIGENPVSENQIIRHITGKNGLKLEANDEYLIINKTWTDIYNIYTELHKEIKNEKETFLIKQFLNYITMAGQVLDFKYIIEKKTNDIIDDEIHKDQFKLFLTKFEKGIKEKVKINGSSLITGNRGKDGLWETFSLTPKGKNPHYTVLFNDDSIKIYLTHGKLGKKNVLFINGLIKYLSQIINNADIVLDRYYLSLEKYNILDWKKGQIKGEKHVPFIFEIRVDEIKNNTKVLTVENFINHFINTGVYINYKQFEFGISIDFYDFSKIEEGKESPKRKDNKALLENPEEIIKLFVEFVKNTTQLYELL